MLTPWYVASLWFIICYWKYDMLELLVWAFIMDILYGSAELHKGNSMFIPMLSCTWIAAILIVFLSIIKKRIRFYS